MEGSVLWSGEWVDMRQQVWYEWWQQGVVFKYRVVMDNVMEKGKNGWGGWEGCKIFFFGVIYFVVRKCFGIIYYLFFELCVLKNC